MSITRRPFVAVDFNRTESNTKPTITNNINITQREVPHDVPHEAQHEVQQSHEIIIERNVDNTTTTQTIPHEVSDNQIVSDKVLDYIDELERENQALRLILEINKSNPLIINSYIIPSEKNLHDLIKILTKADEVVINVDDINCSCCGPSSSDNCRRVSTIFVTIKGESKNFKYNYGTANKLLVDEHISTKFVY